MADRLSGTRALARPPASDIANSTRQRAGKAALPALIVAYALLTVGVLVYPSPVLSLDQWWFDRHLGRNHPQYHAFVSHYVMLGQRGPVTAVFLPLFAWLAWRHRTTEPLVLFFTSLFLLNVSVGAVKYAVGRVGPRYRDDVHQVFSGGTLFPSGHVANTVVMYGVLAMVIPRFRNWIVAAAAFLSLTIGLCTIYLRTHWFSDVVGGWIAGAIVLLVLPKVMPHAQSWTDRTIASFAQRCRRRTHVRIEPSTRRARRPCIRP